MFQSFMLLVFLVIVFGSFFLVLKAFSKVRKGYVNNGIGENIASFPISYKMNGYVIKVGDTYLLCNDLGGMIEIPHDKKFDTIKSDLKFDKVLAEEFGRVKNFDIKSLTDKYKKNNQ